jgi:hypothetical protein
MARQRPTPPPVGKPIRTENGLLADTDTSENKNKNKTNHKPSL